MKTVHLDTTYLMTIFNIETSIEKLDSQFREILGKNKFNFSYSTISIIELKWIIIGLSKNGINRDILEKQFSESLGALKYDTRFTETSFMDPIINDISYELTKLGHKDYFDTVIASNALWSADIFLTQDEPLKKKMQQLLQNKVIENIKPIMILNWDQFTKSEIL